MLQVLLTLAVVIVALLALYGWGDVVCAVAGTASLPWGVKATTGLAGLLFVGGALNAAHLARGPSLDLLVVAGVIAGARSLLRARRRGRMPNASSWRSGLRWLAPWTAVVAVAAFIAATLVPSTVFNFHDDFLNYFVDPVRMLETGTVLGGPLSSAGRAHLGGQAFLQGFALAHLPISWIGAADLLVCAVLLLVSLVSYAQRHGTAFAALLAVSLAVAINPQAVNVTALYSAACLIAALLLVSRETGPSPGAGLASVLRDAAVPALLLAALASLKATLLPLLCAGAVALAVGHAFGPRRVRGAAAWLAAVVVLTGAFLAPWLVVHAPHLRAGGPAHPAAPGFLESLGPMNPFDRSPLFYGNSPLTFTAAMLVAAIAAVLLGLRARSLPDRPDVAAAWTAAAAVAGAVIAYFVFALTLGRTFGGEPTTTRYLVPLVIGAVPAAIVIAWESGGRPDGRIGPGQIVLGVAAVGVIALFTPEWIARVDEARTSGSILAFRETAQRPGYLAFTAALLSDSTAEESARVQQLVPPTERILVWSKDPFHLDFARNEIIEVTAGGISNPWATLPPVRYVLWSYRGYNVKSIAACNAAASDPESAWIDRVGGRDCARWKMWLAQIGARSEILYQDDDTVLFRTAAPLTSDDAPFTP